MTIPCWSNKRKVQLT